MKIRDVVFALLTMAAAASAGAQTCSGGADGGIDATGNQCNTPPAIAPAASPVASAVASAVPVPGRIAAKSTPARHTASHIVVPLKPVTARATSAAPVGGAGLR